MLSKGINFALKGLKVALTAVNLNKRHKLDQLNQPRLRATVKPEVPLNVNAISTLATPYLPATCHVFVFNVRLSKTTKEELKTALMRL